MTTVTSVLSNFMYRRSAERVDTEEPEDIEEATLGRGTSDSNSIVDEDGEEAEFLGGPTGAAARNASTSNVAAEISQESLMIESPGDVEADVNTNTNTNYNNGNDDNGDLTNEESSEPTLTADAQPSGLTTARTTSTARRRTVRGFTLRDLEEERELVQRRTGGCVLLSSFILLRLWIQALMTGDFGLLLLCLVFTSWTAKFVRYTREREEELNRMINEWDGNEAEQTINDARLRRMSFQSQLALAIMQSQIQLMEGGYGHPDGGENKPGVSDEAKDRWDRFQFKSISSLTQRGDYGSVLEEHNDNAKDISNEEPSCSICLCEYEKGEKLVSLPCKHIFHEDCITSWTDHNTRCPLCNADLEEFTTNEMV